MHTDCSQLQELLLKARSTPRGILQVQTSRCEKLQVLSAVQSIYMRAVVCRVLLITLGGDGAGVGVFSSTSVDETSSRKLKDPTEPYMTGEVELYSYIRRMGINYGHTRKSPCMFVSLYL